MLVLGMLALLAAPPQVARNGAVLRAGCEPGSDEVARLEPGVEVAVRFSMNGEGGVCYKVVAGGRQGYLGAADIEGLEGFEQGRRSANPANSPSTPAAASKAARPQASEIRFNGYAGPAADRKSVV